MLPGYFTSKYVQNTLSCCYLPMLAFLFTLIYCSTKPDFLEYWWVFFTFCHQLFHLFLANWGFPSLGIKQFQAGCGIVPAIFFFLSPVFFSGRKWFTSSWTALHWHRARLTDRREDLVLHPAASFHAALFCFLCIFLLMSVPPNSFFNPSCTFALPTSTFISDSPFLPICF